MPFSGEQLLLNFKKIFEPRCLKRLISESKLAVWTRTFRPATFRSALVNRWLDWPDCVQVNLKAPELLDTVHLKNSPGPVHAECFGNRTSL